MPELQDVVNSPEKIRQSIKLELSPLASDNPKNIDYLKDHFDIRFEKTNPPLLPTHLNPSLLGDKPEAVANILQETARYPRMGYLYYPGVTREKVKNNPREIEKLNKDGWVKMEKEIKKQADQIGLDLYQTIKENRFRVSTMTPSIGYLLTLVEMLPSPLGKLIEKETKPIFREMKHNYSHYGLTLKKEATQRLADFIVDTLWKFSSDPRPTQT